MRTQAFLWLHPGAQAMVAFAGLPWTSLKVYINGADPNASEGFHLMRLAPSGSSRDALLVYHN